MSLTMRLVMLILQNRENFTVTRSKPPPPTEDEGLPLAVSSRQEGVEKIASELDCQSGRLQLWRRSVGLIERLRQVMAAGQRPRLPGRENPGCGHGPQNGSAGGSQSRRARRDLEKKYFSCRVQMDGVLIWSFLCVLQVGWPASLNSCRGFSTIQSELPPSSQSAQTFRDSLASYHPPNSPAQH